MPHVAHLAIRNRGTIGGSLSHADPAAELPMLAVFYGATIKVQGQGGRRDIPAEDFFVSALGNCLEPDEIVFEIDFPVLTSHTGWAFEEVARRFGDFALACIAISLEMSRRPDCRREGRGHGGRGNAAASSRGGAGAARRQGGDPRQLLNLPMLSAAACRPRATSMSPPNTANT